MKQSLTDRIKAALFDTLGEKVVGALFLDLFAGTGGVGIEALSRGRGGRCSWSAADAPSRRT